MTEKAKPTFRLFSVVTVLFITIVSHAQPVKYSAPPDIEKAVLAKLGEIQKAAEALDPDGVFSHLMENDNGALIQGGRIFLTRSEALESTRQGFQRISKIEYKFDQQHVSMLSPGVALAVGEGVATATTIDGRTFNNRFAQSVVFMLTDGEWRVFHSHRSSPPAR